MIPMNMFKKNGGFTLVELIVVIAILAILAGVAVPMYSGYINKANEAADMTQLDALKTAAIATATSNDPTAVVASIEVTSAGVVKINGDPISDTDGSELTIRALPLDLTKLANVNAGADDRSFMNRPQLIEGSWPTSPNQCVVDQSALSTPDEFKIGATLSIEGENKDLTKSLTYQDFTIVVIIRTPLYISYERGYTTIGTGKLGTFVYIPSENKTATFHIAGLNEQEKASVPEVRAPYDTDVYCVTCNKTVHISAGEVVPFCCGRLMEILD